MSDPILPPPADKPPAKPEPPTRPIDATQTQALLLKKLQETMEAGFVGVRADFALLSGDVKSLRDRVIVVEDRLNKYDDRLEKNSMRASATHETDSRQDQAIARIEAKLEGDDAFRKLLVDTTKEALGSPMVKRLGQAAAAAAIAALTYLTAYLQLRGGH